MHGTSGIRPAVTNDNLSVAHVQAGNNAGRRTLGVKRSMHGWAATGEMGLAVPKNTRDGH